MRLAFATLLTVVSACAQIKSGRWDATVTIGALKVPFTMHLETNGAAISGALVNGDTRIRSTAGSIDGKTVRLEFEQSGARLEATSVDGNLKGTFGTAKVGMHPFNASVFCTCGFVGEAGADVKGIVYGSGGGHWVSGWRVCDGWLANGVGGAGRGGVRSGGLSWGCLERS